MHIDTEPFPNPIESSKTVVIVSLLGSGVWTSESTAILGTGGGGSSASDGLELCDGGGPDGRAAGGGLVDAAAPCIRVLLPLHRP
jgi:hypothetical protein